MVPRRRDRRLDGDADNPQHSLGAALPSIIRLVR